MNDEEKIVELDTQLQTFENELGSLYEKADRLKKMSKKTKGKKHRKNITDERDQIFAQANQILKEYAEVKRKRYKFLKVQYKSDDHLIGSYKDKGLL